MYNIPGLTKTLQLSSYTACAISDRRHLQLGRPAHRQGQSRRDPAEPDRSARSPRATRPVRTSCSRSGASPSSRRCGLPSPTAQNYPVGRAGRRRGHQPNGPELQLAGRHNGLDQDRAPAAWPAPSPPSAGAIGAVQVKYATDLGFGPTTPPKGVASVLNASGKYTQPTPVDVASALAYATQLDNGTHKLNFNGIGPNVYNPSTYSYLLARTTGWNPAKGAVLSALRQLRPHARPTGVAGLRLRLARPLARAVTGSRRCSPTSLVRCRSRRRRTSAYACGDLTPPEVAAGQTTPTCGVTNQLRRLRVPPAGNNGSTTSAPAQALRVAAPPMAHRGPAATGRARAPTARARGRIRECPCRRPAAWPSPEGIRFPWWSSGSC